jgi:hypothetical protein
VVCVCEKEMKKMIQREGERDKRKREDEHFFV